MALLRSITESNKQNIITNLINKFYDSATQKPYSFLNHVDYFQNKQTKEITSHSISENWSNLTGENCISTYAKGFAVIHGANISDEMKNQHYKYSFNSVDMMKCSKHSRDTGIVCKDGSINIDILENFLIEYSEENENSPEDSKLIIRQSKMNQYLKKCDERDKDLPNVGPFYVSYTTVAQGEWDTFFPIFSDFKIGTELCVTVETLLLFYFNSKELYDRKLRE